MNASGFKVLKTPTSLALFRSLSVSVCVLVRLQRIAERAWLWRTLVYVAGCGATPTPSSPAPAHLPPLTCSCPPVRYPPVTIFFLLNLYLKKRRSGQTIRLDTSLEVNLVLTHVSICKHLVWHCFIDLQLTKEVISCLNLYVTCF